MYLSWDEKMITGFDENTVETLYDHGFLFTRIGKGVMMQTRSVRIDLSKFKLSSENRRVLKKVESVTLEIEDVPYSNYHWMIHKMGKDFYAKKFGDKTFSAQKIKESITDSEKSNFNRLFIYSLPPALPLWDGNGGVGYCICFETKNILHYCYPFYNLNVKLPNLGIGMMLKAIVWAKELGKKYIYLGSAQRKGDVYKLQFEGLEWFDGKIWRIDLNELKTIIK